MSKPATPIGPSDPPVFGGSSYAFCLMHWLLDLVLDILCLLPWWDRDGRHRSVLGESRIDRQTRWIEWALLFLVGLGILLLIYLARS